MARPRASVLCALICVLGHAPAAEARAKHKLAQVSASIGICTSVKNEALTLRPWIEFHVLVGVSRFFVLDDGSVDSTPELLRHYAGRGVLTQLQPFSEREKHVYKDGIIRFARRCYMQALPELDYMLLIDPDEYVFPLAPHCSLQTYLRESCPQLQTHVLLRWTVFGSNGHVLRPRASPIESFLWSGGDCTEATLNGSHGIPCGGTYTANYCNECRHTKALINAKCLRDPRHASHGSAEHWPGRLDLAAPQCQPGHSPRPFDVSAEEERNSPPGTVHQSLQAYWERHRNNSHGRTQEQDTPKKCRKAAVAANTMSRRWTGPPPFHRAGKGCCSGGLALYHFSINSQEAIIQRLQRGARSGRNQSTWLPQRELNQQLSAHALRFARSLQQALVAAAAGIGVPMPFDVSFHDLPHQSLSCSQHEMRAFRGGVTVGVHVPLVSNETHSGPARCCELCAENAQCEAWTWRFDYETHDQQGSCTLLRDGTGDEKLGLWHHEPRAVSGIVVVDECRMHSPPIGGSG